MIIAIDGYSSCGKSTFAKAIAAAMGYAFIDTGAMYRAVTLYALENNMIDSPERLIEALGEIDVEFRFDKGLGRSKVYLGGRDIDALIRQPLVSDNVSRVSAIAQVRTKLVAMQQAMGSKGDVVMDGRDIGTVVFPQAELKIFMTADPEVRAIRRYKELQAAGTEVTLEQITQNIVQRDHQDETRAESPLRKAADALTLDNSQMSVVQQMEWVMQKIEQIKKH